MLTTSRSGSSCRKIPSVVAVEDPVGEELMERGVEDVARERLAVDAFRARILEHGLELHAHQLLEREHRARGMRAQNARDDHELPAGVRLGELLDVARLVLEVELDQHRLAELADDARRRVDAGLLD